MNASTSHFIVDHIDQGRMEGGKGEVSASSVYSNQRTTEVTVGSALTNFNTDHIDQGRKGKGESECKFIIQQSM